MANEKRLIDANELKAIFDKRYDDALIQSHTRPNIAYWEGYATGVNWGRNTISDVRTVDTVEVVHGQWKLSRENEISKTVWCTACGEGFYIRKKGELQIDKMHYCPNCGAKMDGDGNV